MKIKVLGPGCAKCKTLEKNVKDVIANAGVEANVEKVEDIMEIMKYGVMSTPALVVDEKVVMKGKSPSADEIKTLLNL